MKNYLRDIWIEDNLPDDKSFGPEAVKILMRLAYEQGKKDIKDKQKEDERERVHGPMWI